MSKDYFAPVSICSAALSLICMLVMISCSRPAEAQVISKGMISIADGERASGDKTVSGGAAASVLSPAELRLERAVAASRFPGKALFLEAENRAVFISGLEEIIAEDTDGLLVLVDKRHFLSSSYAPADLVPLEKGASYIPGRAGLSLRASAEAALERMSRAALADGVKLVASSSYRSYDYQVEVYNRNVREMGKEAADRESAAPGASQHQLGTIVDFGSITDDYAQTKAGRWLAANAGRFGFSLSFPDGYEDVTGYRWECWHYRYIGEKAASFQKQWFGDVQQYMMEFIELWKEQV